MMNPRKNFPMSTEVLKHATSIMMASERDRLLAIGLLLIKDVNLETQLLPSLGGLPHLTLEDSSYLRMDGEELFVVLLSLNGGEELRCAWDAEHFAQRFGIDISTKGKYLFERGITIELLPGGANYHILIGHQSIGFATRVNVWSFYAHVHKLVGNYGISDPPVTLH